MADADLTDDEQWFIDQGIGLQTEQVEPGQYWTHLVDPHSRRRIAPDYGTGTTLDESVASARRRYEVEQLGIKSQQISRPPEFDDEQVIGLTVSEARRLLEAMGFRVEIFDADTTFALTLDLAPWRRRLVVRDGVVVQVR